MQVLMKILCVIDLLILFSMVQAFQGKIWKEKRLEVGKMKLKNLFVINSYSMSK
jgi:hypothetical protein